MIVASPTDVIGQLTVIHPVVRTSGLNGPSVRRSIELRDLRFVSILIYNVPKIPACLVPVTLQ